MTDTNWTEIAERLRGDADNLINAYKANLEWLKTTGFDKTVIGLLTSIEHYVHISAVAAAEQMAHLSHPKAAIDTDILTMVQEQVNMVARSIYGFGPPPLGFVYRGDSAKESDQLIEMWTCPNCKSTNLRWKCEHSPSASLVGYCSVCGKFNKDITVHPFFVPKGVKEPHTVIVAGGPGCGEPYTATHCKHDVILDIHCWRCEEEYPGKRIISKGPTPPDEPCADVCPKCGGQWERAIFHFEDNSKDPPQWTEKVEVCAQCGVQKDEPCSHECGCKDFPLRREFSLEHGWIKAIRRWQAEHETKCGVPKGCGASKEPDEPCGHEGWFIETQNCLGTLASVLGSLESGAVDPSKLVPMLSQVIDHIRLSIENQEALCGKPNCTRGTRKEGE